MHQRHDMLFGAPSSAATPAPDVRIPLYVDRPAVPDDPERARELRKAHALAQIEIELDRETRQAEQNAKQAERDAAAKFRSSAIGQLLR
jgi:hypothetical protein